MKKYISPFYFFDNLLSPQLQKNGDKIWSAPQFKKIGRELPFAAFISLCLTKHFQRPYFLFEVNTEEVDYKVGYWDNSKKNLLLIILNK